MDMKTSELSFEAQVEYAKSLVGKFVHVEGSYNDPWIVGGVFLKMMDGDAQNSLSVKRAFEKQGFVVAVISTGGGCSASVTDVFVSAKVVQMQLNDRYTAEIQKDKVVVGCQTFSRKTIENLLQEMNKLQ